MSQRSGCHRYDDALVKTAETEFGRLVTLIQDHREGRVTVGNILSRVIETVRISVQPAATGLSRGFSADAQDCMRASLRLLQQYIGQAGDEPGLKRRSLQNQLASVNTMPMVIDCISPDVPQEIQAAALQVRGVEGAKSALVLAVPLSGFASEHAGLSHEPTSDLTGGRRRMHTALRNPRGIDCIAAEATKHKRVQPRRDEWTLP